MNYRSFVCKLSGDFQAGVVTAMAVKKICVGNFRILINLLSSNFENLGIFLLSGLVD